MCWPIDREERFLRNRWIFSSFTCAWKSAHGCFSGTILNDRRLVTFVAARRLSTTVEFSFFPRRTLTEMSLVPFSNTILYWITSPVFYDHLQASKTCQISFKDTSLSSRILCLWIFKLSDRKREKDVFCVLETVIRLFISERRLIFRSLNTRVKVVD